MFDVNKHQRVKKDRKTQKPFDGLVHVSPEIIEGEEFQYYTTVTSHKVEEEQIIQKSIFHLPTQANVSNQ